jgi:hypothetical protein
VRLFDQLMEASLDSECSRGRGESATGTYQDRVVEGLADATEGAAGARRREVEARRGCGHASLGKQHVLGDQQIPVDG